MKTRKSTPPASPQSPLIRVSVDPSKIGHRIAALRGEGDPTGEATEVADSILSPVPYFAGGLDAEFLRRFWGHAITPADVAKNYLEQVRSRMLAEEALDASDPEIERTLRPCVCGHLLVPVARYLRDHGYALLGFQVAYPFEITLPLWTAPSEEQPGVPFRALLDVPEFIEPPAFFRTYLVREERWGTYPEQVRLHAVFQRQDGSYTDVRNPYTLALLREALGL